MLLNTRHDMNVPIADVFAAFADTPRWERAALRRGIQVKRVAGTADPIIGTKWNVKAVFRGKPRDIIFTLTQVTKPTQMVFTAESNLFNALITLDLIGLSARATRVSVEIDLTSSSIAGRILLQSLKLAKGSLQKKVAKKIGQGLADLGDRLAGGGRA